MAVNEYMEKARGDLELEAVLKRFHERWAPHNEDYDSEYHADFYMLVRRIYQEAQAPYLKAMSEAVARQPMPPPVVGARLGSD